MVDIEVIGIVLVIAMVAVFYSFAAGRQRFHGVGEAVDGRNTRDYGEPVRSLYTQTKVFTLHHRMEILDDAGTVLYRSWTKFPSIHDKTEVERADGTRVAHIERKLISLHETHFIDMEDGERFTISNELFHLIKDVTNIEELGWQLNGNILALNFVLTDQLGQVVAVVGQKLFSLHDRYSVDIYQPAQEEKVVAILVTLQHMIRDRRASSSSSGASSSSSSS